MYVLAFSLLAFFQNPQHANLKDGLALAGYDAVSYFSGSEPTKGSSDISVVYQGEEYFFSSEKNKNKFQENPEMYVPAYGGWCAYAMGVDGTKVKVDPETFKILDSKLHLYYNFWGNNTLKDWNKDEKNLQVAADNYWSTIIGK